MNPSTDNFAVTEVSLPLLSWSGEKKSFVNVSECLSCEPSKVYSVFSLLKVKAQAICFSESGWQIPFCWEQFLRLRACFLTKILWESFFTQPKQLVQTHKTTDFLGICLWWGSELFCCVYNITLQEIRDVNIWISLKGEQEGKQQLRHGGFYCHTTVPAAASTYVVVNTNKLYI